MMILHSGLLFGPPIYEQMGSIPGLAVWILPLTLGANIKHNIENTS